MRISSAISALDRIGLGYQCCCNHKGCFSLGHLDNNRRFLFDTDGRQIDAYGSKVNNFNGKYYLYGNSFSETGVAYGIKSYSSSDLQSWYASKIRAKED
ncbi:unnamed protein product [Aureobasidium pullulans]|nr:unnamed protein product [Aureobasidium pullulans]